MAWTTPCGIHRFKAAPARCPYCTETLAELRAGAGLTYGYALSGEVRERPPRPGKNTRKAGMAFGKACKVIVKLESVRARE